MADTPLRAAPGQPPGRPEALVEIQVSLCTPPAQIERALDLHPRGATEEEWLFDDEALTLYRHGLRVRLRRAGGRSELTLKVADQDCAYLAPDLVPPGKGKCEYDMHGTRIAGAVSLSHNIGDKNALALIAGRHSVTRVLSAEQVRYLRKVVGLWPLPNQVRTLGPQRIRPLSAADAPYEVDVSELPTGDRFVEISRRVPLSDAPRSRLLLEEDLRRASVEVCADQAAQLVNKLRLLLGTSPK